MNYLIRSLCAFGLVSTLQSAAAELSVQQIKLEHPANGSVVKLKDRPLLLVSGHNVEHRWLSLVDVQSSQAKQIAIPRQLQFFQQANLAKVGGAVQHSQLVALGQQGIWQYDESNQRWSLLTQVASAYPVIDQKRFSQLSFTDDFNNDQLTDFLVPDFAFWHVLMQQADGSFRQFSLPMDAEVQLFREDPEFRLKTAYRLDFNADGLTDVLFQRDDQLWLYRQQADGSFSTQALTVNVTDLDEFDIGAVNNWFSRLIPAGFVHRRPQGYPPKNREIHTVVHFLHTGVCPYRARQMSAHRAIIDNR